MTPSGSVRRPYGVIGVFVLMLGAGVILDADRPWGYGLMAAGVACLFAESRQGSDD